jgi:hypothetical protein
MLRNGFLCGGGGKLAHIGWNQIHPAKRQKMFRKMFEHFCNAKMFRWGRTFFSEHFQSWNEIANTQKIAGWYKVYIQGISKPNEKQKMKAVEAT